jgi:hypothetical protein
VDDNRIGIKEVNSKKQARLPDKVIEELDIQLDDENQNMVEFHQNSNPGEIILRGMDS